MEAGLGPIQLKGGLIPQPCLKAPRETQQPPVGRATDMEASSLWRRLHGSPSPRPGQPPPLPSKPGLLGRRLAGSALCLLPRLLPPSCRDLPGLGTERTRILSGCWLGSCLEHAGAEPEGPIPGSVATSPRPELPAVVAPWRRALPPTRLCPEGGLTPRWPRLFQMVHRFSLNLIIRTILPASPCADLPGGQTCQGLGEGTCLGPTEFFHVEKRSAGCRAPAMSTPPS